MSSTTSGGSIAENAELEEAETETKQAKEDEKVSNFFEVMETETNDQCDSKFKGFMLSDNLDNQVDSKKLAIEQFEQLLASNQVSSIRSLTWLVAAPYYLDVVRDEAHLDPMYRFHLVMTLIGWAIIIVFGSLLLVTGFLQAPRVVGYVAGGFFGIGCLTFLSPMFARSSQEFAGHLTPPLLPPVGQRVALNMQQWLQLLISSREDLQDLLS